MDVIADVNRIDASNTGAFARRRLRGRHGHHERLHDATRPAASSSSTPSSRSDRTSDLVPISEPACSALWPRPSLAAAPPTPPGLYYADRGVRPLGRAGAFVAGADDLGAIVYNPAGIFDAGGQFLIDGSWVHFTSDYTRVANVQQVDPNTGQAGGHLPAEVPHGARHDSVPAHPHPGGLVQGPQGRGDRPRRVGALRGAHQLSHHRRQRGGTRSRRRSATRCSRSTARCSRSWARASPARPIKQLRLGATVGMLTGVFKHAGHLLRLRPRALLLRPRGAELGRARAAQRGPHLRAHGLARRHLDPAPHVARRASPSSSRCGCASGATLDTVLPTTPIFPKRLSRATAATSRSTCPGRCAPASRRAWSRTCAWSWPSTTTRWSMQTHHVHPDQHRLQERGRLPRPLLRASGVAAAQFPGLGLGAPRWGVHFPARGARVGGARGGELRDQRRSPTRTSRCSPSIRTR